MAEVWIEGRVSVVKVGQDGRVSWVRQWEEFSG